MHCKDCQHWEFLGQECRRMDCGTMRRKPSPSRMYIEIHTADDEWDAVLRTGPNFGCVLFEAKE